MFARPSSCFKPSFHRLTKMKNPPLCPPASPRSWAHFPHSQFHAIIRTNIWNTNTLYFSCCSLLLLSCRSPVILLHCLERIWALIEKPFFLLFYPRLWFRHISTRNVSLKLLCYTRLWVCAGPAPGLHLRGASRSSRSSSSFYASPAPFLPAPL